MPLQLGNRFVADVNPMQMFEKKIGATERTWGKTTKSGIKELAFSWKFLGRIGKL